MEWSTTSNEGNERVVSMAPPPRLESNFSDCLSSYDYDPYAGCTAGNSSTHAATQTGPVVSEPESEKITNAYQCPSNTNEIVHKKKALTSEQLASLEQSFLEDIRLDPDRKLKLSEGLGLQPRQVAVWFQNRRARWKVKHLEESYDLLRLNYEVVCREKQMLQDEVKKLRDIILRNHCSMMDAHQINGIGENNSRMMDAPSCWPPSM